MHTPQLITSPTTVTNFKLFCLKQTNQILLFVCPLSSKPSFLSKHFLLSKHTKMEPKFNLFDHGGGGEVAGGLSSESSSSYPVSPVETELELGLGLSIGGRTIKESFSFSSASSGTSSGSCTPIAVVGSKRGVDEVVAPVSQIIGWPPVRAHRIKIFADRRSSDIKTDKEENGCNTKSRSDIENAHQGDSLFVKVNMDGDPIGRKVDVYAHSCYETLAQALEDMFYNVNKTTFSICLTGDKEHEIEATKPSKLLKGSTDFVLTYEDKEGDLMLVGDVPWRMFLETVKKLRIQRRSQANGLCI